MIWRLEHNVNYNYDNKTRNIEGSLTAFLKSLDKLGTGAVPAGFKGIDTVI